MKKRMISLLLALVMVLGLIPATTLTASAESNYSVWVGGVGMNDGDYLANGATKTHTTKPSGGYAYYKDSTLTLNNYSYVGKGYQYSEKGWYATVYAEHDLTVELVGTNTLTQTAEQQSDVIRVHNLVGNPDLTVDGNGKLIGTADDGTGLLADGDITINGGTIAVTTYGAGIMSFLGNVSINGGDIIAESKGVDCIYASYDVTINGGNVTAISATQAIGYGRSVTIAKDLIILASTTAYGELGEYIAANHTTYKKIVITPKPEINNVSVNGTSVADGATYTSKSKNLTIKTTYDSTLSQALTDYGCTVKKYGRWYLNGEKINVAAVTPVDNGDGTSTETFYRTLSYGDELEIETWLEAKWPDGTTDIVDEHTVTIKVPAPQFTTQPTGGTVGYNERHTVNWRPISIRSSRSW